MPMVPGIAQEQVAVVEEATVPVRGPGMAAVRARVVAVAAAEVTAAAADGKITVRRPFDTAETALSYVGSMAGAKKGAHVVVLVFGEKKNAANQKIVMYADGSNL